jgi:hypothetical protein
MQSTKLLSSIVVAAVLVASGAFKDASAQQLKVCLNKKGTKAQIRTNCKKRETEVDPGQVGLNGPKGDPGVQGPAGPAGVGGARGPSDGRFFSSGSDVLAFVQDTDQTVASLNLPAGNWVITAKVVANNNDASVGQYGCMLLLDGTEIDSLYDLLELDLGGTSTTDRSVATLTAAGTLAADSTADVVCRTNSPSGNWLARTITAIQVETFN